MSLVKDHISLSSTYSLIQTIYLLSKGKMFDLNVPKKKFQSNTSN